MRRRYTAAARVCPAGWTRSEWSRHVQPRVKGPSTGKPSYKSIKPFILAGEDGI